MKETVSKLVIEEKPPLSDEDIKRMYKTDKPRNIVYIAISTRVHIPKLYKIGITSCKLGREKSADIFIVYEREVNFAMMRDIEEEIHENLNERRLLMPLGIEGRSEYFYGDMKSLSTAVDQAVKKLNSRDKKQANWYYRDHSWIKKINRDYKSAYTTQLPKWYDPGSRVHKRV